MGMLLQQYLHPEKEVNTVAEEGASADVETVEVEETEDKPEGKKAVKDDGDTAAEEGASADS
ncbi:hypothetical protein [Veillonella sp. VA137]|uniref:hypothetical protein n=1 Tax=Veillonella sp. VA137 TaxID=741828 RepID=UPI000F8F0BCF|nr:hypothetical protein [Veillonella sp. VA137]